MLIGKSGKCKKSSIVLSDKPSMDFITLIRFNKPAYQPGDTVRFLVFALDYDTKPYKFNEISVDVLNSRDKVIRTFNKTPKDFKFNSSFEIPNEANSGEWKLHVRINKIPVITKKIFHIQNVVDNRVKVFIEVPSKVSIYQNEVTVNVFAKHFTDMYASGKAKVTAKFLVPMIDFALAEKTKVVKLSGPSNAVSFNFKQDFNINILSDDSKISFEVEFTDDLSGNSYAESREIDLSSGGKYEIRLNSQPFLPGFDHEITINLFTLDGQKITQSMKVSMELKYSNSDVKYLKDDILQNGKVTFTLQPPENAREISMKLTAGDSNKRVTIVAVADQDFFEANLITKL